MCFSLLHWFIFVILVQNLTEQERSNVISILATSGCLYKPFLSALNCMSCSIELDQCDPNRWKIEAEWQQWYALFIFNFEGLFMDIFPQ